MRRFEWDEEKAKENERKHGISFERAIEVFDDPLQISKRNRIENGEQRFQIIGRIEANILIIVIHTVQENGIEIIRIISARPLSSSERRVYEHGSIQKRRNTANDAGRRGKTKGIGRKTRR